MSIFTSSNQNFYTQLLMSAALATSMFLVGCSNSETPKASQINTEANTVHKTGAVIADENGRAGEGAVFFNNPRAIGEEPNGNIIVADFSSGHIVRIDRTTGDRTVLSDNNNPDQGPVFSPVSYTHLTLPTNYSV